MRWSDGAPFTADDFEYWFTWEFSYLRDLGYPHFFLETRLLRSGRDYGRIEKVDAGTVRFVFPNPNPFFLELLASTGAAELFAPKHYLEPFHPKVGEPVRDRRTTVGRSVIDQQEFPISKALG
jgi:peptide/nickel transport system substrate-binding protein